MNTKEKDTVQGAAIKELAKGSTSRKMVRKAFFGLLRAWAYLAAAVVVVVYVPLHVLLNLVLGMPLLGLSFANFLGFVYGCLVTLKMEELEDMEEQTKAFFRSSGSSEGQMPSGFPEWQRYREQQLREGQMREESQ